MGGTQTEIRGHNVTALNATGAAIQAEQRDTSVVWSPGDDLYLHLFLGGNGGTGSVTVGLSGQVGHTTVALT